MQAHARVVGNIRAAIAERPGCNVRAAFTIVALFEWCNLSLIARAQVAIMLDTKGPEIRTGKLKGGANIELAEGQDLIITTDYEVCDCAHVCVSCARDELIVSVCFWGRKEAV